MTTENAQVLPLSPREGRESRHGGRTGVRLEATRRGRVVLSALAVLLGAAVMLAVLLVFDVPSALAGQEEQSITVTVQAGDTLWGYAQQHAPEGVSEQEYIAQVRSLNHLSTGRVTAGEEIELPRR